MSLRSFSRLERCAALLALLAWVDGADVVRAGPVAPAELGAPTSAFAVTRAGKASGDLSAPAAFPAFPAFPASPATPAFRSLTIVETNGAAAGTAATAAAGTDTGAVTAARSQPSVARPASGDARPTDAPETAIAPLPPAIVAGPPAMALAALLAHRIRRRGGRV